MSTVHPAWFPAVVGSASAIAAMSAGARVAPVTETAVDAPAAVGHDGLDAGEGGALDRRDHAGRDRDIDRVAAGGAGDDERVLVRSARDRVGAVADLVDDRVVARAAIDDVGAEAAVEGVVARRRR